MYKKSLSCIVLAALVANLFLYPFTNALAATVTYYADDAGFDPSAIIPDSAVFEYNSMTLQEIDEFVIAKGGTLGSYRDPVSGMPAFWLIWQVAQEYKINPKFILTMLQKEQALVTDDSPTKNQYDWAVGYSCYGGVCLENYRGFYRQISAMANKFINGYLADLNAKSMHVDNLFCTFTKWCVGSPKQTQDLQTIIPKNKITAALYTYNPYRGGTIMDGYKIGANYNFWRIWHAWFDENIIRPTGTLLKTDGDDTVYLIQNGEKRAFANFSAFITRYSVNQIKSATKDELKQYPTGATIKFSQYSLLQNKAGDIYLVVDDQLKRISSMAVFKTLGFNPEEIETVDNKDLAAMPKGEEITMASAYPIPVLMQDKITGGIYKVENGTKYPIMSKEILQANFGKQHIIKGHSEELAAYPKGEPVKFKDGSLIKSRDDSMVYFISQGKKLPILSEAAFISRGYNWQDIIETSPEAVELQPTGASLNVLDQTAFSDNLGDAPENLVPDQQVLDKVESLGAKSTTTASSTVNQ